MLSIAEIQHWASVVPDYMATALVLLVGAALTAACGLIRRRDAVGGWLPGALFVACCALAMWPVSALGPWWSPALPLAGAAAALSAHIRYGAAVQDSAADSFSRASRYYLLLALVVGGSLLFLHLGTYSGDTLLGWEATVIRGFGDAFQRGESTLQFAAQRLLWDDGILSAGDTSLFYGAPTYALFKVAGFSVWTMRCGAVIATLIGIVVGYSLARHFFGAFIGAAVAGFLALNPAVLFYGRYGSSPAGTMLAVLLAMFATWLFLERERSAWWRAVVCAVTLYLATVQYSPARIVVLMLLAFVPVALVYQWRTVGWRRLLGVAFIALGAATVWHMEGVFHRQGLFLQARGEQFFELIQSPDYINSLYGRQMVPPHLRAGNFSFFDKVQLLGRALLITVPQYLKLMLPALSPPAQGAVVTIDPPPLQLYYGPAAVFIVWGLVHSLRRWRSWPHVFLLFWVAAGTVPLLLTNRVDSHRTMLFVIPLSCWAAFGLWEAAQVTASARVPVAAQHLLAVALLLTGAYSAINLLFYERPPQPLAGRALATELATVPGRVSVAAEGWQREVGWAYLQMLERTRQDPGRASRLLEEGLVHGLQADHGSTPEAFVRELQHTAAGTTLLMMPAENFRNAANLLAAKGLRISERGLPEFHVLRVDGGEQVTGIANEQVASLPTPVPVPTPAPPKPIVLRAGVKQWVTDFAPLDVSYGFAPPKVDRTWNDAPLRMGGIEYPHGIGMHAWCRATYPVPENATGFQAIVGLADGVRECERAAVTFEVRDDKDRALFDSGLVDNSVPPQPIDIPLHDTKTITLVVTEGGNGPNCDHADWALAAFMLRDK